MRAVIVKNEAERRIPGLFLLFGRFEEKFEHQDQTEEIQHTFYGTNSSYNGDHHSEEGHQHDVILWCGPIRHFSYSLLGISE